MKRILFVAPHRPNRSPSQRYRFEQYLTALEAHGYSYHFSYLLDAQDDQLFYQKGRYLAKLWIMLKGAFKRWRDVRSASQYDFVFVHREAFMLGTTLFEKALSKRSKLIYDFDDAIWLLNTSAGNRALSWLKRPAKTQEIIELADTVIVGNAYLAQYAKQWNEQVVIIPTTIDLAAYTLREKKTKSQICIGWTGSPTTRYEFSAFEPILKQILDKYPDQVYIKLIGDEQYQSALIPFQSVPWQSETEVEELRELDIGIMPLRDTDWNRGKCACKGLQYMALGIPAVMSAVGVNMEIVQSGENGMLCSTEQQWIESLSQLIEDASLRERLGKAGRKTVEQDFAAQEFVTTYLQLFENRSQEVTEKAT